MKYVTHYKHINKGFTLVELLIATSIVLIISSILFINFNPLEEKKKARDNVRLADLATLERAINEYFLDNHSYPGDKDVLYTSNNNSWNSLFSTYLVKTPTDPLSDIEHIYYYKNNGSSYEVNAKLEYFSNLVSSDNGNDISVYEVGNNLRLISPN